MRPIDLILSKLPEAKRNGSGWSAKCPAHDDRNPSLSITEGEDGRCLIHCHAGCRVDAVVAAMGLELADLMPADRPNAHEGNGPVNATTTASTTRANRVFPRAAAAVEELERIQGKRSALWTYHDVAGEPCGVVVRWDRPDKTKDIRPVSRTGDNWHIGAMPEPRPLYRLPTLADTDVVVVCEGEKAADAACKLGYVATTSAGGSKAAKKTDWSPLAGKHVVIVPDRDEPGEAYADDVASVLMKLNPRSEVRVVHLADHWPDLPKGGDLADVVKNGDDNDAIKAELDRLTQESEPVACSHVAPVADLRYHPFPTDALPEPVRSFVQAGARALFCDESFIALPMLAMMASAIGNTRRIQLKPTWPEPATLWTVIVCGSGTVKSPAIDLALKPLREREARAFAIHREAMRQHEIDLEKYERARAKWKSKGGEYDDPPTKPETPIPERFSCDNATIEAVTAILNDRWRGILVACDELGGWLSGFGQYKGGRGNDVSIWLTMHGARMLMIDRRTGNPPTMCIPMAFTCITGAIPPKTLARALGEDHVDDGLAARLFMAMPPRRPKRWTTAGMPRNVESAVADVFNGLCDLKPGRNDRGEPQPITMLLTREAEEAFKAFFIEHDAEAMTLANDGLESAFAKLEGGAARIALVLHLMRVAAGDSTADPARVDKVSITAGILIARWFCGEAKRVYAVLIGNGDSSTAPGQRGLVDRIRKNGGSITERELSRSSRDYQPTKKATAALDELVAAGTGVWEHSTTGPQGGKPTRRFRLVDSVDVAKTPANDPVSGGSVNCQRVNAPESETPKVDDGGEVWGEV